MADGTPSRRSGVDPRAIAPHHAGVQRPTWTVAVDTGGTFTDLMARGPAGEVRRLKVPSTPDDPARAILDALATLDVPLAELRHGTTVATNALLEGRTGRVVLVTNVGFEDLLQLRRQARPDLYALHPVVPPPVVPRDQVLGVLGRRGPGGEVLTALEDPDAWVARHRDALDRADAVAISLLHAYADAADERALAAALCRALPDLPVTLSSDIAAVSREYERTATAAVNAALTPVMSAYVGRLRASVHPATLTVMGSAGGRLDADTTTRAPVHTVLSGPAGGVRGAWTVGARCGRDALLTLDMGGTSTDVSVVDGALAPIDDGHLAEHPLRIPLLPIETVGAGGGSVAFVDPGGALRVGPRSAGAVPGPACYGRGGTSPTVTDAHVVLGRLDALLGGDFELDRDAARAAVGGLAERIGSTTEDTAHAILTIVEANMARACKRVSMGRGVDPRALTLVAFGGAGGLHACGLADELGCPEVLFPAEPGVLSAAGILDAPRELALTRSLHTRLDDPRAVADVRDALLDEARARLPRGASAQVFADCRYQGQTWTLAVPFDGGAALRADFEALHADRYGYALPPSRAVEVVALRVFWRTAEAATPAPVEAPDRSWTGPCAVRRYSATLWLPAGWRARQLPDGDLLCARHQAPVAHHAAQLALALEVHRQRLAAVAEEMGATLMRAAFSANIKERRDFSCAVFDASGQLLVHAAHIPVHLGSTPLSVRAAIDAVPMPRGTQVVLNDPFAGGTHLPDVTLVTPVFLDDDDAPAFYVANRAHHADVGGVSPGSLPAPRDADGAVRDLTIDDEGIRIPPARLDDALRARFSAASRTPEERAGDLRAQEAANRRGAARLVEWAHSAGRASVDRDDAALLDYAERRMRAVLAALPDGVWSAVEHLDDDGVGSVPVPIPLTLTLDGAHAVFDFTAAPDQVAGPLNAVRAIAVSAVFYALRCLAGDALPANAGLMRPITVRTRPGSIVDALPPAAVAAGNVETSQRMVDVIFAALAQCAPERVPAASCGSMNNVLFGADGDGGFVHYETLAGGAGAGPDGPGADAVHTHMTNTLNTPVEALEQAFPVRVTRYALAPRPTVPPGITPGGRGVVRSYRFLAAAELTLITERRRLPPTSTAGAPPGALGHNALRRADAAVAHPIPGKVTVRVEPGDEVTIQTPGGAHWAPVPIDPSRLPPTSLYSPAQPLPGGMNMGFFDKLKSMKNAITGGSAKVQLSIDGDDLELGKPFAVHITAEAKADVKATAVYILVRSTESTHATDDNGRISKEVVGEMEVYNHRFDVEGPQELKAGETYEWTAEICLPDDGDARATYDGEIMNHDWEVQAGLDVKGNDPDSGWLGFEIW